jgi:hypothetical protein
MAGHDHPRGAHHGNGHAAAVAAGHQRRVPWALAQRFGIDHATIQLEREHCTDRAPCSPQGRIAEARP